MKQHRGGLGRFLNEVTQTTEKSNSEQIVYIDIDNLETNPRNFYGLRDVEALAGLIAVSHLVEPLTVSRKSDGKYMIISGHRRRAAVQKLLDEGDYTERKLPCIIKTRGKIKIEQENGEVVEFDEDAVEMLNLIASNRGQREERTVDEKLQEVKYLETFAKAIYHQKNRGSRGRFRNFFAEEILNMSKSQLQRISAMEKLTDKVRTAIDDKTISESAALAMSNMTAEEQVACLEKIMSGKIRGTAQDIQSLGVSKIVEEDLQSESIDSDLESNSEEFALEENSAELVSEEVTSESGLTEELAQSQEINLPLLIDVPEKLETLKREAKEWFYQERLMAYEAIYAKAKRISEEKYGLESAQWGIRASVARYNIEELKLCHGETDL